MDEDIKVTPAQRAYLVAFDNWLHTIWKRSPLERPPNELATGLKNAALADLLAKEAPRAARRVVSQLPAGVPCKGCGGKIPKRTGPGRPRKFCHDCKPVRLSIAA